MVRYPRFVLVFMLMLLPSFFGCVAVGGNPEARWYQARATLNAASRVFTAVSSRLSDEQIVRIGADMETARGILEATKLSLPEGGLSFDQQLLFLETILLRIESEQPHESI